MTLAKKFAQFSRAHRKSAMATAQLARDLADLQPWSGALANARLFNPDYPIPEAHALPEARGPVLTDAQAGPRKIAVWEDQEISRRTVTSEIACALRLAERTAQR